jgi:hypothetical protein
LGFGYVFKKHRKFLGQRQNFTDTIWKVKGVWVFSWILLWDIENEKWTVGPHGQAIILCHIKWHTKISNEKL